ncbi:MAG: ComF family protein [Chitinophagaceae bacterium]
MFRNLLEDFEHLFFPRFCPGCAVDTVPYRQTICLNCLMELPETGFFDLAENPVKNILKGRLAVERAASLYYCARVSKLHNMIHQLKYKHNADIGLFLGRLLGRQMLSSGWKNDLDLLVPVPLHPERERQRGYNQTKLIADGIAHLTSIPIVTDALVRTRYTQTQTHKGRSERIANMEDRFRVVKAEKLQGKHVLLIDDLVTTGATLEFCGQEILKVPGTRVSIATVGKSIY